MPYFESMAYLLAAAKVRLEKDFKSFKQPDRNEFK
jgi:hypothetical protein